MLEQDQKLHNVTQTQARLLEYQPGAPGQQTLTAGQVTNLGASLPGLGLPETTPAIHQLTSPVCVSYGAGMSRTISAGCTIPANAAPTGNGGPAATVDRVWLPQGRGALIGVTAGTGQPSPRSWYLLDGATRYGLTGPGVAAILGYQLTSDETVLPAALVDALPAGRSLDPGVASQPAG